MEIQTKESMSPNGVTLIVTICTEKLDLSNSSRFKKIMDPLVRDYDRIILDMKNVNFIDSSGFGTILGMLHELTNRSGDIKLCNVQRRVRMILEMVRIHKILAIMNSQEDALRAFASVA